MRTVLSTLCVLASALTPGTTLTAGAAPSNGSAVRFTRDVEPILARACAGCHGAEHPKGGLRLDSLSALRRGGRSGPAFLPGDSRRSRLTRLISGAEPEKLMPLGGPPLPDREIRIIRAWIDQGARSDGPTTNDQRRTTGNGRSSLVVGRSSSHWAFRPVRQPSLPSVRNVAWARNPIDRFVLARLEREGLKPAPAADRATLIRRLSLDLRGLPPSPAEVTAFLAAAAPDAYERLVDRFLASPHYGEQWARWWLDAARYADTNGYEKDNPRQIWLWRDWVIDTFNRDLPFDRFAIDQISGDLLESDVEVITPRAASAATERSRAAPDDIRKKIATGFHRNTMINQEGGVDQEEFRTEAVIDRVGTTGQVFLGLTVGCARCHDHKYDPISQREFYGLFAFFNNADEPELELATPEELAKRDAIREQIRVAEEALKSYRDARAADLPAWESGLAEEARAKLSDEVRAALAVAPEARDAGQKRLVLDAFLAEDAGRKEREAKIAALKESEPRFDSTLILKERAEPRVTNLLMRGEFLRRGQRVYPAVPAVLHALPKGAKRDRLTLARWLVSRDNPLTARVTMNRVWQSYWGRGLVATTEDFGIRGERPSHPELLDWLAAEFMRQGWSLKAMHRLIVTSAAYRQTSRVPPRQYARDPYNVLLARGARFRLPAEAVRDTALAASGLLNPAIGGPSVYPPQPEGVTALSYGALTWKTETGPNRYRRALYTFFKRTSPYPALIAFDAPNADAACVRRARSNTPLQALTTLNDTLAMESAHALARRVLAEAPSDPAARVRHAFRLCLSREADPWETRRLVTLYETERARFHADPERARLLLDRSAPTVEATALDPAPPPLAAVAAGAQVATSITAADTAELAAWTTVARVVLNLDETITRE